MNFLKKDILLRLKRIEGQIRGLQRMVQEEASCVDILTQVAAVTSAIKKVGSCILQTYFEKCLEKTEKYDVLKQDETIKEFQKAISRYIDWA